MINKDPMIRSDKRVVYKDKDTGEMVELHFDDPVTNDESFIKKVKRFFKKIFKDDSGEYIRR